MQKQEFILFLKRYYDYVHVEQWDVLNLWIFGFKKGQLHHFKISPKLLVTSSKTKLKKIIKSRYYILISGEENNKRLKSNNLEHVVQLWKQWKFDSKLKKELKNVED